MESVSRERFRFLTLLVVCVCVIFGLGLFIAALVQPDGVGKQICEHLATVVLVGATSAVTTEFLLRRDFVRMIDENAERILEKIKLAGQEDALGLREVQRELIHVEVLSRLILESQDLTVMINDGRTWVSNNSTRLETRFRDPTKNTTFVLLDPDGPIVAVQARKESVDAESIRGKVRQTVQILCTLAKKETDLKILVHDFYNPQTVFLGDDVAVVTPYFTAPGRKPIPAFIFRNTGDASHFSLLRQDALELVKHSKAIDRKVAPPT